jgi:hypothetical protein
MRQHRPCYGRDAALLLMHAVAVLSSNEIFMAYTAVPMRFRTEGSPQPLGDSSRSGSDGRPAKARCANELDRTTRVPFGLSAGGYVRRTCDQRLRHSDTRRQLQNVRAMTEERTGYEARWARTEGDFDAIKTAVRQILARPLSVDDAVQIALINNRRLQATYADVSIG